MSAAIFAVALCGPVRRDATPKIIRLISSFLPLFWTFPYTGHAHRMLRFLLGFFYSCPLVLAGVVVVQGQFVVHGHPRGLPLRCLLMPLIFAWYPHPGVRVHPVYLQVVVVVVVFTVGLVLAGRLSDRGRKCSTAHAHLRIDDLHQSFYAILQHICHPFRRRRQIGWWAKERRHLAGSSVQCTL